jgi:hypothetical protein
MRSLSDNFGPGGCKPAKPAKSFFLMYDSRYLTLPRRLVNGTLSLISGVGLVTSSFSKAARAFDKLHSS